MNNNKVLYNVDQRSDTSEEEKARARDNIGAEKAGKRGMCWATWHKTWGVTPSQDNPLTSYVSLVEAGATLDSSDTTDNSVYIVLGQGGSSSYHPILAFDTGRKIKWTYILEAKWINSSSLWGVSNATRLIITDDTSESNYARGAYPLEWSCQVVGHKGYDGTPDTNRYACPDKYKFISEGSVLSNTTIQWNLTVIWEDVTDA
jgi:hypothetical protein